jgi:hypothetical protein
MIIIYDEYTGKIMQSMITTAGAWTSPEIEQYEAQYSGVKVKKDLPDEEIHGKWYNVATQTLDPQQEFTANINKRVIQAGGSDKVIVTGIPQGTKVVNVLQPEMPENFIDQEERLEVGSDEVGFYVLGLRRPGFEWYNIEIEAVE